MTEETENKLKFIVPTEIPPHALAFIIDGVVQEVINTSDRFAAICLSDPVITYATGTSLMVGQTTYDAATKKFTHPDGTTEVADEFEIAEQ